MVGGVLLDIAGVVLHGAVPFPKACAAIGRLEAAGLPYRFVTNTTSKPRRRVLENLRAAGIDAAPETLFAPEGAACLWLARHRFSPQFVGNPALLEDFAACETGLPPAVVIGDAGSHLSFADLNGAFRALIAGAPFLALATNRVFTDADGELSLDDGAFVEALRFSSGVEPVVLGKPSRGFFSAAAASMGCDLAEVVMVGDDAEDDVAGALSAGAGRAILVRTGKYASGDEARFEPRPTSVVADLEAAVALILDGSG